MSVLIGIPTHKRPELLRHCLEGIEALQGDLPPIRVFVADNDAKDQAGYRLVGELAASYRFPISSTVVIEPGISAARNAILGEARREGDKFIVMIDDDETASPEWLEELLAIQQATAADIIGGPVHFRFQATPASSVMTSGAFLTISKPDGPTHDLRGSGNLLIRSAALARNQWPLFDADFGLSGGEDSEWFARLSRLNVSMAWAADAIVTEHVSPDRLTSDWILRRAFRSGNSNMRMCLKLGWSRELRESLVSMVKVFALAPFYAPALLFPGARLRILRRWWTAGGHAAALLGIKFDEYASRH